ncbi:hypothetical protein CVT24_010133 [Panaeolus cyanescens]|uniref:Uncharacterized protein n=1 Tax=Panaeolus cyanescens TaxID=181874 RepID=A0A409YW32_9AGAR|nr:hypothetical protein CVT24_010133 [Panaeolus cyanescens]
MRTRKQFWAHACMPNHQDFFTSKGRYLAVKCPGASIADIMRLRNGHAGLRPKQLEVARGVLIDALMRFGRAAGGIHAINYAEPAKRQPKFA